MNNKSITGSQLAAEQGNVSVSAGNGVNIPGTDLIARSAGSIDKALGIFALMRIDPKNRVIEVRHVVFGDQLKRTGVATEAHYLLACYVFETL